MKTKLAYLLTLLSLLDPSRLLAQSTAFTYQGRLNSGGTPASGQYEISFALYDAVTDGNAVGTPITLAPIAVSNGLFTATLDFGIGAFTGAKRWLELSVTVFNSDQPVVTLLPRQPINPTPYAVHATRATTLGNDDTAPVEIFANGARALRLEGNTPGTVNVIGGAKANRVSEGVAGATIGGGGALDYEGYPYTNQVFGDFGTIAGGANNSTTGRWSTVGGGLENSSGGHWATISGGWLNVAPGDWATIGGGYGNTNLGEGSFIGGGRYNSISGGGAIIGGGFGNMAIGAHTFIGGGLGNLGRGDLCSIGGGVENVCLGEFATLGGGRINLAGGNWSTISGGHFNVTSNENSTIAGGENNSAFGGHSAISGGRNNAALGNISTISGGEDNSSDADLSVIAGGSNNHGAGVSSAIGGGSNNKTSGDFATIPGGWDNRASGKYAAVGGGAENEASGYASAIGGGNLNQSSATSSTVAGGEGNIASGDASAIGGGGGNEATAPYSTVGGGVSNHAAGEGSYIGGGNNNESTGENSSIGGGYGNISSNSHSIVPGGFLNVAGGSASFAAGTAAHALHDGAFVWADQTFVDFAAAPFPSETTNEFAVRATGGVRLVTAVDDTGTSASGVSLAPGSGTWSSLSDRNAKENFTATDARAVLEKVAALHMTTWNYKTQGEGVRHIGPMAQDFHAAFGFGENDRTITTVDADGVALTAIQGLNTKLEEQLKAKDARISDLERRLAALEQLLQRKE